MKSKGARKIDSVFSTTVFTRNVPADLASVER